MVERLAEAIGRAATRLPEDVVRALESARAAERSARAAAQLDAILENVRIASDEGVPLCQDTGIQTFFVEAGVGSPFLADLRGWIGEAVVRATEETPLRPNTVHPLTGANPGDNSGVGMPVIHWDLVDGEDLRITILPKGGGSENMSALKMLPPGVGIAGIKKAIVDHVIACGGKPCPPTVLGIGIGGGADAAMKLGKHALLRPVGSAHPDDRVAALEEELLELVNETGVGAMGVGGDTSCLAVHVEIAHRHPASLPLGILVQCWADRRAAVLIAADGTLEVV
ncbi:MAG: fumarate hydratase [Candidatus Bipolaricaulota bacterium]|nr:MAG: fumarate hydratase [Candidatus Bipolaricaulota bacterium]